MFIDDDSSTWVVCKFGGSSVADPACWDNIRTIAQQHRAQGHRVLLVCSALKGVTNLLVAAADATARGQAVQNQLDAVQQHHHDLAQACGLDCGPILQAHWSQLADLCAAARGACTPDLRARIIAFGEQMSTRLGVAILAAKGLDCELRDAETLLQVQDGGGRETGHYLSASVPYSEDRDLQQKLAGSAVVLTQGFIAGDSDGALCLLGRGGSDTSAAYFAAKLNACLLEIWTDVPGVFSANPHQIPTARRLDRLDYREAEAISLAGGKVLHPRSIAPAREQGVPVFIKSTNRPDWGGTLIESLPVHAAGGVKAVTSREGLWLFEANWQSEPPLKYLPRFSEALYRRKLQVNMVSAGARRLQATVDPLVTPIHDRDMLQLMNELNDFAETGQRTQVHSVSLVGGGLEGMTDRLAPVLDSFEAGELRHIGRNSDRDVTLLVDEQAHTDDLVARLHEICLEDGERVQRLGPTWLELQDVPAPVAALV